MNQPPKDAPSIDAILKTLDQARRLIIECSKLSKLIGSPPNEKDPHNPTSDLTNARKLLQHADQLKELLPLASSVKDLARIKVSEFELAIENAKRRFGPQLESALQPLGHSLSGQLPELKAGFYTLEIVSDFSKVKIWYGPKQEYLGDCRPEPSAIFKKIQSSQESFGCHLEVKEFARILHDAWIRTPQGQRGEHAPIIDVLREMAFLLQPDKFMGDPRAEFYKGYGRIDFSFDLYRMKRELNSNNLPVPIRLVVATRDNTSHRSGFLWVPTDEKSGSTYAYISFPRTETCQN
jgi:hypothetical protein